jgi:RNA polymerase sigma factor (TIGR02999 family)
MDQHHIEFHNRSHFFGAAGQIIRRILVDRAREKGAAKRGGGAVRVELEDALAFSMPRDVDVIALDMALAELAAFDAQKAQVVELRYFAGLSIPETVPKRIPKTSKYAGTLPIPTRPPARFSARRAGGARDWK